MYIGTGSYMKGFFVKWVLTFSAVWLILSGIFGASFFSSLFVSTAVTVVGYAGDVFIMPFLGNVLAAVGDVVIAFGITWLSGIFLFAGLPSLVLASLVTALGIGVLELVFHRYMATSVFDQEKESDPHPANHPYFDYDRNLRAEFGEEFDLEEMRKEHEFQERKRKEKKDE